MAHFEIQNLTFSYPNSKGRKSLNDVSLTVEKGEYVVLCGKSGSGKTTLLRHLKSVLTPHGKRSGNILFNGVPMEQVSQRDQAAKIGYVMQNPDDQIVTDKVWHELAFGLESLGCDQKTMRARVAEMACYFGIQDWFHRDVANLSGGQKQLLNLASIMAMQPEVLILDEPTSQLDPIAASDFLNTVRKINIELGTTVIITEHRMEDIFPYADRAIVMDEGRVIADDTPRNIGQLEILIPFLLAFEGRKPQARELVVIAVMAALAVAARVVIPIPSFKAIFAIIMLSGIAFGPEAGFMVGAVSAFASNFFYGQGAYTPWQMFAYGAGGMLAGFVFGKKWIPRKPVAMGIFGFFTVLLFVGPLLDTCSVFLTLPVINLKTAWPLYVSGFPVNLSQGVCTFLTMVLFGKPLLEKLDRVKVQYGMMEDENGI